MIVLATTYGSVKVQCPFYQADYNTGIICEGFAEGSTVNIKFRKSEDKRTHKIIYCDSCYAKCEIYKLAEKKYPE